MGGGCPCRGQIEVSQVFPEVVSDPQAERRLQRRLGRVGVAAWGQQDGAEQFDAGVHDGVGVHARRYQAPGYQIMPSASGNVTDAVVNTRNDDSVRLLDTGPSPDRYICIPRNTAVNLGAYAHPNGGTWANDIDVVNIWQPSDNGLCSGSTQVRQCSKPDGWRP